MYPRHTFKINIVPSHLQGPRRLKSTKSNMKYTINILCFKSEYLHFFLNTIIVLYSFSGVSANICLHGIH